MNRLNTRFGTTFKLGDGDGARLACMYFLVLEPATVKVSIENKLSWEKEFLTSLLRK